MAAHSTEISVSARYAELPRLMAESARQAAMLGLADADLQRLQLVLEELFTNTIVHGHRGECGETVQVRLSRHGADVQLRYSDNAPPFDLTGYTTLAASDTGIGGQGIPLLRGMSKAVRYARRDELNITELDF